MSSPNSERNVTTSNSSIRASSTGRRQWTKPSLVSALEVDLSKSNQMIESLKVDMIDRQTDIIDKYCSLSLQSKSWTSAVTVVSLCLIISYVP
jgi:hypothetical protein